MFQRDRGLGSRRNRRAVCLPAVWALLLAVCCAGSAAAQSYQQSPIADALNNRQTLNQLTILRTAVLRGQQSLADNRDQFRLYYTGYLFPRMTQYSNPEIDITAIRDEIFSNLRFPNANEAAHAELVNVCLQAARGLAEGDYHPATRYNAMLIIGELNSVEGAVNVPPQPLSAALDVMLGTLRSAEQIDAVKVAALIGIQRHVQTLKARQQNELTSDRQQQITQTMLALLNGPPPAGRDPQGHAWIERQAIEILALLGQVGDQDQVFQAFLEAMSSPTNPLFLRCAAAKGLAELTYPGNFSTDSNVVYRQLGLLAYDCCQRELDRVNEWILLNEPAETEEAAVARPGAAGQHSAATDQEIFAAASLRQAHMMRVRLKEQLDNVQLALDQLGDLAKNADQRDLRTAVSVAVGDALKALDRNSGGTFYLEEIISGVETAQKKLANLVDQPESDEEAVEPSDDTAGEDSSDDGLGDDIFEDGGLP